MARTCVTADGRSDVNKAGKPVYVALGCICTGLGFIGAFVPGMPTTVFVLLASYFFARSSPRLNGWLRANRWLGPSLRRFQDLGGMTRAAKVAALASMWTAVTISAVLLLAVSWKASLVAVGLAVIGTLCILWKVKTVPESARAAAAETSTQA